MPLDEELFEALTQPLDDEEMWERAKPQAVSNTAWAYVRLCTAVSGLELDECAPALALALESPSCNNCPASPVFGAPEPAMKP